MRAIDKAIEIMRKFREICTTYDEAKKCALLCVDEVIRAVDSQNRGMFYWWIEVSDEIKLL